MTDPESFLEKETDQFCALYLWLKESFSEAFFKRVTDDELLSLAHSLGGFKLQGYFIAMNFPESSIVLSRDEPESDIKIFNQYESRLITSLHTFVSENPLPDELYQVRITLLSFGEASASIPEHAEALIELAKKSDYTQCELLRPVDWQQNQKSSLKLRLSCREAPRIGYIGRLLKALLVRELHVGALFFTFVQPDILYFEADLHGIGNKPCWESTDVQELMQGLVSVRDFATEDMFETTFVRDVYGDHELLHFLRSLSCFVQQLLYNVDPHMYSFTNVQEAFCYWPELTKSIFTLFCLKADPYKKNLENSAPLRQKLLDLIDKQDTGKQNRDLRRKTCLRYGVYFVDSILKTNFFVTKKGAISYRLDSSFLQQLPTIFPRKPFGIFYIYSRDFFGFHIRFQDLARGGLRTVAMRSKAASLEEAPLTFLECYQLAWTQEKKNKDIPEGGSKGICFLFSDVSSVAHLYRAQRLFIDSLLQLVTVLDPAIVDYYGLPEYLYLGPDENMHDAMIEWVSGYAKKVGYLPGNAFITSKPRVGINHKRYGVTSLGVNVCMVEVLKYLGIDPAVDRFTVKMSGGPDGDVAGNQILNLEKYFSKTAKLITLIDVSGVIYDPEGLDLVFLKELFAESKPIRFYPPEKLSNGGFLLDMRTEKKEAVHIVKILCMKKAGQHLREEWLSGSEAQEIIRTFVHKTPADVFIPAGGRPATLNQFNVGEFLDSALQPTAKAIIEGANLYLTTEAREFLEQKGTIIIKDSSANKGGVISSSYEVIASLSLSDEEFLQHKEAIIAEIKQKVEHYARDEVRLILDTYANTKEFCSRISEQISERINRYSAEIRDYLQPMEVVDETYMSCFLEFCLPLLTSSFHDRLMAKIPDVHKKAVIASWIASKLVYQRGLEWSPSVIDVLPFLIQDPHIASCIFRRGAK